MYRRFDFEGDIHQTLDCVPMSVRRKLDLAQLKISLAGWQSLSRAERLALCHLPAESEAERLVYVEVLRGFADRAGAPLTALPDATNPGHWSADQVPSPLRDRAAGAGVTVDLTLWSQLDEDARFALTKLSDPRRDPAKLMAALVELGFSNAPRPSLPTDGVACGRP